MPRGKAEQAEVIIPKLREVEVELGRSLRHYPARSAIRPRIPLTTTRRSDPAV